MKTKVFFLMMLLGSISWSSASVVHVYIDDIDHTEWHYFCSIDTIIVHKPTTAVTDIYWSSPYGHSGFGDSIVVTAESTGDWYFYSDEISKDVYIYIISSDPVLPSCMDVLDTIFCTASISLPLDAQNQNPGGNAASYQWSTGATTRTITVTNPDNYTVTVTNACGSNVYYKNVYHSNPNAPHLGLDQTFCWGSNSTLDPGSTNVSSYQWSTGETTPTISVDITGNYWVYVIDNNGCSGRDTVHITALLPIGEEICYVEFDTLTWKNNINWMTILPGNADSIKIYKETSLDVWTPIGIVSKTSTHFLDIGSVPQSQSYSYKIALLDTCGNESAMSSYHTTITLLSAYDQPSNTYGFTWSAYYGLTVNDYYLFGVDADNNVTQIATVPGNVYMYNYLNPNSAFVKYLVGFETPDCNGTKANVIVKSNWVQSVVTGIENPKDFEFSVFPNPVNEKLEIRTSLKNFEIEIINVFGQVLLKEKNSNKINVDSFASGTYILKISGDNFTRQERIIVY